MKDTTKTIIIGSTITILVLIAAIFTLYKTSDKKDNNTTQVSENRNNSNNTENNNSIPASNETSNNNEANENNNQNNSSNTTIKDNEANNKVILYMFHGSTCPHCIKALNTIKEERTTTFKNVEIRTFEVYNIKDNRTLYQKVNDKLNVNINSVPYFIIGNYSKVGFNSDTLLSEYKKALNNKDYQNIVEQVIKENPDLNPVYETI